MTGRTSNPDSVVAVPNHTLAAMMRKRAHLQFSSVKAGNGPIPTGQSVNRNSRDPRRETASCQGPTHGPAPSEFRARAQPSTVQTKPSRDSETSATGAPRTLRAKPSVARLREASRALEARSPNVLAPADVNTDPANKRDTIMQSPVMSAMLRSRTQKTISSSPHSQAVRQSATKARPTSTICGNGIKVKGSPVQQRVQEVAEKVDVPSPPLIRVKLDPRYSSRMKNPIGINTPRGVAQAALNK